MASTSATSAARHLDTTNVLYVDGHVKSQKLENIAKGKFFTIRQD